MRQRVIPVLAVVLSSLAAVAVLLALELALRAVGADHDAAESPEGFARAHRYSESLGWEPRRDVSYTERGVSYTLNAAGQRGAHYGPERRPGTLRAVLLGDSLTYGHGVDERETFAHLVDVMSSDVEVVNLGVQGYGIDQSLITLEERGLAYQPDVVVLDVCAGNDFLDDLLPWFLYDDRHPKPYYSLEGDRLLRHDAHLGRSPPARLTQALRERSVLVDALARLVAGDGAKRATSEEILARPFRLPDGEQLTLQRILSVPPGRQREFWRAVSEVSFRLVAEIGRVARAHDAAYHVLLFPSDPSHFAPGSWYQGQIEDARARPYLNDVSLIDMREAFARRGVSAETFGRYYLDTHCHLSPAGHRVAAEVVTALLHDGARGSH